MTDWQSKWIDALKKETCLNGRRKERPPWSKKIPKKEPPQPKKKLQTHNVPTDDVKNTAQIKEEIYDS